MATLSSLVRDEALLAQDVLAQVLAPLLTITGRGEILPTNTFQQLPRRGKVLAVLLALKAMRVLNIRTDEAAGPTEIAVIGGIPLGSVKPEVRALERENIIIAQNGRYSIPVRSINVVAKLISTEATDGTS